MAPAVFGIVLLSVLAAAVPSPVDPRAAAAPLHVQSAEAIPGKYIVKLKDDTASASTASVDAASILGGSLVSNITQIYNGVFKGYAGAFNDATLALIRALPDVEFVEQDSIASIDASQQGADYGLAISSEKGKLAASAQNTYYYDAGAGKGVTAYVIDTGVFARHADFKGRARMAANFVPGSPFTDENGHGTHCAGTIGGSTYGIAKSVQIRGIKVLDKEGHGPYSSVIAGINFAVNHCPGKCVISMSLNGGSSPATDSAVANAVKQGVTTVVAAGNSNAPACDFSPSAAPAAITVGAIGNDYARAEYSNYGNCVDIFAPGTLVKSTWIGSSTATNTLTGTSMACPHVVGIAAYYLGFNTAAGPIQVLNKLKSLGKKNILTNVGNGSPNLLANNGYFK